MIKRRSFKHQILLVFCMVSLIPVIIIGIWLFVNTSNILSDNTDELIQVNLNQTRKSVKASIEAYSDLLYQMYTNDKIVELTDLVNGNEDPAVNVNRLKLELKAYAYAKPNIRSITLITQSGEAVFYDMLTAASTKNSWIHAFAYTKEDLYKIISNQNNSILFPSQYACTFGEKDYYLFHMGNRIIDYHNVNKKNGVIILSIDENVLNEACNQENTVEKNEKNTTTNFIVDQNGKLVTFADSSYCGETITTNVNTEKQVEDYENYVKASGVLTGERLVVHMLYDEELQWTFVNVSDQTMMVQAMKEQQRVVLMIICISAAMLTLIIFFLSNHLTSSIKLVIKAMKKVETGDMSVRIASDKNMSTEIATIANQFNRMIEKVNESVIKEKKALEKQKDAEIAVLEAQIDPHFIYNILDTVNWMAIDKDQYQISNTINALGKILRYGINQSNQVVEIREEVEWLKQYLFLQQTRLKNTFTCKMHVEPNVLGYHIHKLLFQPFVENAILHGFEGMKREHIMEITINEAEEYIKILIADNGKGMSSELLEKFSCDLDVDTEIDADVEAKNHIGIRNAIGRLRMYYGEAAKVSVTSTIGEGSSIWIQIPKV